MLLAVFLWRLWPSCGLRLGRGSGRAFALDRHAVHDPARAAIVVDRVVLDATIVPERDRIGLPAETAGEFRAHRVVAEIFQQRGALRLGHVLEAQGEGAIDVKRLP